MLLTSKLIDTNTLIINLIYTFYNILEGKQKKPSLLFSYIFAEQLHLSFIIINMIPSCCRMLSSATILLLLVPGSTSFSIQNKFSLQQTHTSKSYALITTPSQLSATIIAWDDDSDSYTSSFDEEYLCDTNNGNSYELETIAEHLSQNGDKMASLARLAAAFSPPGQGVDLKHISKIQITAVESDHIEISAVVCDESECVTLFVPVTFPHDCNNAAMEECILDNIGELDVEAQQLLKQREIEANESNSESYKELLNALFRTDDIELPSWWISPDSNEMSEECQLLKRILNQNDENIIKALATEGLSRSVDGDIFEIRKAVVVAVGHVGLYFRALAVRKDQLTPHSVLCEESNCTILDIPYAAFNTYIKDPATLRSSVLGIIASLNV